MIFELVNSFLDRPGNVGIRAARILKALADRNTEDVLCISRGGRVSESRIECVGMGLLSHFPRLLNGIRIFLVPGFNHRLLDIRLFSLYCKTVLVGRKVSGGSLAHIWEYTPKLIGGLKKKGIPVILDVPIAPFAYAERLWREGRYRYYRHDERQLALELLAFSLADILLVPSEFVAEELERLGINKNRIKIVHFGVDMPMLQDQENWHYNTSVAIEDTGIHWVMLGNVNFRKGVAELLEVWRDSAFATDTLHLCGRLNPEVKDIVKNAGPNVLTPGFVKPTEYLRQCHIFVMPSWMEGSSKAVFEAMAMGLPAIVSRSTGSVVRDGIDGFVVEAGDVDALHSAMLRFKREKGLIAEMGKNAAERARSFSWERYAESVLKVYDEFLSSSECRCEA